MKISNFRDKYGQVIPYLFIVTETGRRAEDDYSSDIIRKTFRSQDSVVAIKTMMPDGSVDVKLDKHCWEASKKSPLMTVYRNQFLRETSQETEKKIESGEYKLANLNI